MLRTTVKAVSALVACGVVLQGASALATTNAPDCTVSAHVCTYTLPFLADTYRVDLPSGVDRISVTARGASSGGGASYNGWNNQPGGQGATVQATFAGIGGRVLYAATGGIGGTPAGGYNGGGDGVPVYAPPAWISGGGGGASDVRVGSLSDAQRLIVAGGAGGASAADFDTPSSPGKGAGCWEADPGNAECAFQTADSTASAGTSGYTAFGGGGGGYRGGGANWSGSSWVSPARLVPGTDVFTAGLGGDQLPPVQAGLVVISYSLTPDAPTGVSAAATGASSVRAMWSAPAHTGGLAVTYTATATGGRSCTTTSTSCTITGLSPATSYMVTVVAENNDSRSDASAGDSAMTSAVVAESVLTPTQTAKLAAMPTALTMRHGKPISRTDLLKAAGLKAKHGAKVSYVVAGATMGGMKPKGAGLMGVKPGTYLVTITVTSRKGKPIAKAIEVAIT